MMVMMMMKLMMTVKISEYLQYADYFAHIIKKDQLEKKWLNIRLWGASVSNHYCFHKAKGNWSRGKLLGNDSFIRFFSQKKGDGIMHRKIHK